MVNENVELAFSDKYDKAHSEAYYRKHKQGFWRNRSNNREIEIARRAIIAAGKPDSILDLPCGAGRFWSELEQSGAAELIAADNSESMLEVAKSSQPEELVSKFKILQTSAFDIKLPDKSVDCIFSMRLIHHIGEPSDRARLLKEYHRVTRETVCLSLWVDGNYQAWRRKRLEATRVRKGFQNRFVIPPATIEGEFEQSGFKVRKRLDMTPLISMWRIYVLEKV
jgi:SAM-dependent methyltransferase